MLAIAPTGYGKDHARKKVKELADAASVGHIFGGELIGSGPGMLSPFETQPVNLFLLDEIHLFFGSTVGKKLQSQDAEIQSVMLRLYSSADTIMRGKETKGSERMDLRDPHCCIYGTATAAIWEAFTSNDVLSGLLSRFVLFDAEMDAFPEDLDPKPARFEDPPDELVSKIKHAYDMGRVPGEIHACVGPTRHTVHRLKAEAGCEEIWKALREEVRPRKSGQYAGTWVRTVEHAIKLGMLASLGRLEDVPVIRREDAQWGAEVAMFCSHMIQNVVEETLSDSDTEKLVKQMIAAVRKAGKSGLPRTVLTKKFWRVSKRERDEALSTLSESGVLRQKKEGKRITYYATGS
jgi:hypothetical protein